MTDELTKNILSDMRVELADEFDDNFSKGGFFGKKWQKRFDGADTHLVRTGILRRSIQAKIRGSSVVFSSSEPYAAIHNDGGTITVTAKMRKYFWAQYLASGKKGKQAQIFKALALKKVGSKIKIPQRRFIGFSPQVKKCIETIIQTNVNRYTDKITQQLKNK